MKNLLLGSSRNIFFSAWQNVLYNHRYSDICYFLVEIKILIKRKHQQAVNLLSAHYLLLDKVEPNWKKIVQNSGKRSQFSQSGSCLVHSMDCDHYSRDGALERNLFGSLGQWGIVFRGKLRLEQRPCEQILHDFPARALFSVWNRCGRKTREISKRCRNCSQGSYSHFCFPLALNEMCNRFE